MFDIYEESWCCLLWYTKIAQLKRMCTMISLIWWVKIDKNVFTIIRKFNCVFFFFSWIKNRYQHSEFKLQIETDLVYKWLPTALYWFANGVEMQKSKNCEKGKKNKTEKEPNWIFSNFVHYLILSNILERLKEHRQTQLFRFCVYVCPRILLFIGRFYVTKPKTTTNSQRN